MTPTELRTIEAVIGYRFQNPSLLKQAFTRSSYVNELAGGRHPSDTESNEVLEFFGDSVLSMALAYLLLEKYSEIGESGLKSRLGEKDFTLIKSNMSDKRALANAIRQLGIGKYMRLSRGDQNQNVLEKDSPNEDLFESIVAAVALDSGMDFPIILDVVRRLDDVDRLLAMREGEAEKPAKTRLKEYCEKHHIAYHYEIVGTEGPDHAKTYFARLTVEGHPPFKGEGAGRAKAEADAARAAIRVLVAMGEQI